MQRLDDYSKFLLGMALVIALIIVLSLIYETSTVRGADEEYATVCRQADNPTQFIFHVPASWNNPDLPSWWALGSDYEMLDETTIRVTALQEVEIYGEGFPQWEQDLQIGQALVGSWDYRQITTGDQNSPLCIVDAPPATETPETPVAPRGDIPGTAEAVSTGRTCTVKYPQIILVCNG